MGCPIEETKNGKRRFCESDDSDEDPCETCTDEKMRERMEYMHSTLVDEAYERFKEKQMEDSMEKCS